VQPPPFGMRSGPPVRLFIFAGALRGQSPRPRTTNKRNAWTRISLPLRSGYTPPLVIARSESDEAIQNGAQKRWIAPLAMTAQASPHGARRRSIDPAGTKALEALSAMQPPCKRQSGVRFIAGAPVSLSSFIRQDTALVRRQGRFKACGEHHFLRR
jgi:hypothetical protein